MFRSTAASGSTTACDSFRRFVKTLTLLVAIPVLIAWTAGSLAAAGREVQVRGNDFLMVIDSRWAGCGHGGFYPIRVRISNLGPTRTVTLRFQKGSGNDEGPVTVTRSLRCESNSTQQTTLSIPVMGMQGYGLLTVMADGATIDSFTQSMSLSDYANSAQSRPSLLVVSAVNEDATGFDQGAYSLAMSGSGASYSPYSGYARSEDHQVLPPGSLPDKWLDYTGIDYVAIALNTLESMPASARDPLLDWAMSGGNLIVYEVGAAQADLDKLLGRGVRATFSPWSSRRPEKRPVTVTAVTPGMPVPAGGAVAPAAPVGASWPDKAGGALSEGSLRSADFGLGRIHAFDFNPFGPTGENWAWFLQAEPETTRTFSKRYGTVPRERSQNDFYQFLIPGVGAAPVFMFLALISLFTFVIGPINLWFLSRRRQLYLMLLTVPVLSLVTCLCLFVYAFFADGLSTRARVRSVTMIDSGAARAVTLSRIMLYAGLTPSRGLGFSDQTAVLPVWSEEGSSGSRSIDWTNSQSLTSGWLPSRTFTQFATVTVEPQRGRLEVKTGADGVDVNNGLAVGLKHLFVSSEAGLMYYGDALAAGASGRLKPLPTASVPKFGEEWLRSVPKLPEGLDPTIAGRSAWGAFHWTPNTSSAGFAQSLMEKELGRAYALQQRSVAEGNPSGAAPRWFWAITEGNPGVSLGTDAAVVNEGFHVVTGRY
jgi:hypothetical protein